MRLSTDELTLALSDYLDERFLINKRPTYKSLASYLGVCTSTVRNINIGSWNGHPYTDKPSPNRFIRNSDFALIRELFKENTENEQ